MSMKTRTAWAAAATHTYKHTHTHSFPVLDVSFHQPTVLSEVRAWPEKQDSHRLAPHGKTNTETCFGGIQWIEFMVANLLGICRLMCQLIDLGNQSPSSPNHRTERMQSGLPVLHWQRGLLMSSATKDFTLLMHQHFSFFFKITSEALMKGYQLKHQQLFHQIVTNSKNTLSKTILGITQFKKKK